jgi:hypothetical protein
VHAASVWTDGQWENTFHVWPMCVSRRLVWPTGPGGGEGRCPAPWGVLRALLELIQTKNANVHCSATEVYQGLAYDLLNDRSPLNVGTKRQGQRTGMGDAKVAGRVGASKTAVGGTHPAGCRCQKCLTQTDPTNHPGRRRLHAVSSDCLGAG